MKVTKRLIQTERESLSKWISELESGSRISSILSALAKTSQSEFLKRMLLINFALAEHLRSGGLKAKEIRDISQMGDLLIRVNGIHTETSVVGELCSDMHRMLGQIFGQKGAQWEAAWMQSLALRGQKDSEGKRVDALVMGQRMLRLGLMEPAIHQLREVWESDVKKDFRIRAGLLLLSGFRLAGLFNDAEEIERGVMGLAEGPDAAEVVWERLCRQTILTDQASHMVKAVKKGGTHVSTFYAMECFLWTRAVRTRHWIIQYPKFRSLVYNQKIIPGKRDHLFQAVSAVETLYDSSIDLSVRLSLIGRVLSERHRLSNIGLEALLLSAVLRWFTCHPRLGMRELVEIPYQQLSLNLTQGASSDCMGFFSKPILKQAR